MCAFNVYDEYSLSLSLSQDGEWVTTTMKRLGNPWDLKSKVERDRKKAEIFCYRLDLD